MPARLSLANGTFEPLRFRDDAFRVASRFVDMCGRDRWRQRIEQLAADFDRSPYEAKIASDYHWMEFELGFQTGLLVDGSGFNRKPLGTHGVSALLFAHMAVSLHAQLADEGSRVLEGRLADGLNAGFAALFHELDTALMLIESGCEVGFPDFEGEGDHDLDVAHQDTAYAVECKSLSPDAGRKIHRRDFYRLMSRVGTDMTRDQGQQCIVLVTMDDRLTANAEQQQTAQVLIREALTASAGTELQGPDFVVRKEDPSIFEHALAASEGDMNVVCQQLYGDNCHVAGPVFNNGYQLVVLRSRRADDPSKAGLSARKAAGAQLPKDKPGIVALQYGEILPADLARPIFRRKAAILDGYCFLKPELAHVGAFYHCAFTPHHDETGRRVKPGFASWSAEVASTAKCFPFQSDLDDATFSRLLVAID